MLKFTSKSLTAAWFNNPPAGSIDAADKKRDEGLSGVFQGDRQPAKPKFGPVHVTKDGIEHKVPYHNWQAAQHGRTIEICDRDSDTVLQVLEPPIVWGSGWGWNINETGDGIVFKQRK